MPVCLVAKSAKQREKPQTTDGIECTLKIVLLLCNLWKTSKLAILNQKAHLRLDHCVPYQGDKKFYIRPDDTFSTTEYPFFIPRTSLVTIGNCITSSRPYIPVSFQGSFDNVFSKIDGTRAVDWLDFLLYIVPTLVVPFLSNRAVKTAVLSLVKGCALALQWTLTSELLDEMDVVFRPVQHYLMHIPFIVKQLGPLRCYSTRSMERVIGVFSKLIKSKCKGGRNASFLVERFTLHNYVNTAISIQNEIDLIQPKPYGRESHMHLPNDFSGAQLWEPFHRFAHLNDDLVEGVSGPSVKDALTRYYQRTSGLMISNIGDFTIVVAGRLWMNPTVYSSCMYQQRRNERSRGNHYMMFTCPYRNWLVSVVIFFFQHEYSLVSLRFLAFVEVMKEHDAAAHDSSVPIVKQRSQNSSTGRQTQPTYAVISVNDIRHQVGLIQYPPNGNQFYIISSYYVFNNNMRITKGNLSIL
ncbi:hypothetical protein PHYBLDRAFT_172950 [Phycomyces blakesleeanus NRRL 1555(-)]|uniref:Uncharacterized protein n=1 Tax=Phycomyces blakesleeanus (strain ATCC 8743b / DSM 1359 / FGSC 10004 / NBRC 33097 / NRRL 1555) TaxID=763407 RepID=A0A162TNA6_PHYB8|nr:hypothetical protein PHYBLDRAFT_172950 [Phycomyces blakesleeanus NRRL 1555(-)]OAD68523.1 hypothetical protein PHYBLDRAFT_172950 [Phycomyces blakesleeanus NRRL 1555(-)]|eukprot:XP_018286563.1 hypothetical protein PHYBLDRAFT_172950 [Phycomyces blakesleeanus NRRL 1555(-)]